LLLRAVIALQVEREVMSMSQKTNKIRAGLEARLESLQDRLAEINETLREPEDDDFEEQAVEVDDDDLLERLSHAGRAEVILIEAALKRIQEGTYGMCLKCGQRIPEKRLRALPEAESCLDCARQAAKR
jgi:RNA polymerase-binding transcription factor DksA